MKDYWKEYNLTNEYELVITNFNEGKNEYFVILRNLGNDICNLKTHITKKQALDFVKTIEFNELNSGFLCFR